MTRPQRLLFGAYVLLTTPSAQAFECVSNGPDWAITRDTPRTNPRCIPWEVQDGFTCLGGALYGVLAITVAYAFDSNGLERVEYRLEDVPRADMRRLERQV